MSDTANLAETIKPADLKSVRLEVPPYQRAYAWTESEAELFLSDISEDFQRYLDEIRSKSGDPTLCRLGAMLVYEHKSGDGVTLRIVDGQQRTTTLFLLVATILREMHSRGIKDDAGLIDLLVVRKEVFGKFTMRPRLIMRDTDEREFLAWLVTDGLDPGKDIEAKAREIFHAHQSGRKNFRHKDEVRSLSRMSDVLDHFAGKMADMLVAENDFSAGDILTYLGVFLCMRVRIIKMISPSELEAIRDFEKMNNRGISLSTLDILRANVLGASRHHPSDTQKKVQEMFNEVAGSIPDSERFRAAFLRAHALAGSTWASHIQGTTERDALTHLQKLETSDRRISQDPIAFMRDLRQSAQHYCRLIACLDPQENLSASLKAIEDLGVHKICVTALMAARNMPPGLFERFARLIETAAFVFLMGGKQQKGLEAWFFAIVEDIRKIRSSAELDRFEAGPFAEFLTTHQQNASVTLASLNFSIPNASKRLFYVLARISDATRPEKTNSHPDYIALSKQRRDKKIEIEHILPQSRAMDLGMHALNVDWIGNLTLLEKELNIEADTLPHDERRSIYTQSAVFMTRALGRTWDGNCQFARAAAAHGIPEPSDDWSLEEICGRGASLMSLIEKVWGLDGWDLERMARAKFPDASGAMSD